MKNQTEACEDPEKVAHVEKGGSFIISLVVHDDMFTVIRNTITS